MSMLFVQSGKYDQLTAEFLAMSWLQSIVYINVAMTMIRMRYYFAWMLSEASVIGSGMAYSGVDPKTGATLNGKNKTQDVLGVEFSDSPRTTFNSWNMATNRVSRDRESDRTFLPPRCDAMRCDAMRCDAMRCDAMR